MKKSYSSNLCIALVHYPVVNKNGDVIASAVTNLDLHDISRLAKTYGVSPFYVVTPLKDQRALVEKIVSHWTRGTGARYNPMRQEALELIRIRESLAEVADHIRNNGEEPEIVVTSARDYPQSISHARFREMLTSGKKYVLSFGTAWGLSEDMISEAHHVLDPIKGNADYNHLSVRSAVSIMLDRLIEV
ncbi:RNA methyltransferase [Desulfococcaceae bacterium HSG8]|nr:RNA methyltransferase [Desulfococcaceae bacterium HSG8]